MVNAETLESNVEERANDFRAGAQKAKTQLNQAGEKIRAQAEDAWDDLIETVKRHPGKALGITLAAGFAVGTLASAASRRRTYSASDQARQLAGTGADAWDRLRAGFEDAACTLKDAMEDAVKKFK